MNTSSALAACLVGAVMILQPTYAHATYRTTTVVTGDLNLQSSLGQKTLERRIAAAARKVCSQADHRNLDEQINYNRCIETAKASTVEQINKIVMDAKAKHSAA